MKIIDSVAAVFCHERHILAIRRQSNLDVFPGYDSFPGGKIDQADLPLQSPVKFLCNLDGQMAHALIRELKEELNYNLVAGIRSGQVSAVKFLASALAPITAPVRFRLYFFRIDLNEIPEFIPDCGEIEDLYWITPEEWIESYQRGEVLMVPPLRLLLKKMIMFPQDYDFGDISSQYDEENSLPVIELLSGLRMLFVTSSTFPVAGRTNAFIIGDDGSCKILVDPAPRSTEDFRKLLRTLQSHDIHALFITHHHLDHHEQAPQLAKQLNVPMWMSEDTRDRIIARYGDDYLSDVTIEIKKGGDKLVEWKGEAVFVHPVPGHDAGQLALATESMCWFIVGDIIQDKGSVVILAPAGDMAIYFETLENLIELNPKFVIPSHGLPMRGVYRLRAALQHRHDREKCIYELHKSGKTENEIFDCLYQGIGQELVSLARGHIKAHLAKLMREGKI